MRRQVGDLVDWAVRHRRVQDLRAALKEEHPEFFPEGAVRVDLYPPWAVEASGARRA
jgi:hypothetical protein